MNNLDITYQELLKDILANGIIKQDRTGTGTKSVFGRQIRHKMSEGFPLLTTKKMYFKGIVTEMLWFLSGNTNIKYLVDNDCNIWTGDAYKAYVLKQISEVKLQEKKMKANGFNVTLEPNYLTKEEFTQKIKDDKDFADEWGNLGPIYGKQWRDWYGVGWKYKDRQTHDSVHNHYDQIANLINDLKNNPDSRRLMVNAWNVAELDKMVLPPCHYGFQLYTRELTDDEVVMYFYKHIKPETKWSKRDESYFYFVEDLNMWVEHSGSDILFGMRPDCPKRAISLMWNQRSVDTFLGLPFNIASYGLLLEMIAKEVNMVPDELIGNLGDTHLYLNHLEQAEIQINRTPYELPKLNITQYEGQTYDLLGKHYIDNFELQGYQSHPTIKANLSN